MVPSGRLQGASRRSLLKHIRGIGEESGELRHDRGIAEHRLLELDNDDRKLERDATVGFGRDNVEIARGVGAGFSLVRLSR